MIKVIEKLKKSYTDELLDNPHNALLLYDEVDKNLIVTVSKVDGEDVHVLYHDTVNGTVERDCIDKESLNDMIKDNAGTCKLLRNWL